MEYPGRFTTSSFFVSLPCNFESVGVDLRDSMENRVKFLNSLDVSLKIGS